MWSLPPEQASTPPYICTIQMLGKRAERTGPTRSASLAWNMAVRRVSEKPSTMYS